MNKMNKKGFTLIEMLVVIAIIAILVSIIIPVVASSTEKAACAANAANLRSVKAEVTIKYATEGKDAAAALDYSDGPLSNDCDLVPGGQAPQIHIDDTTDVITVYYLAADKTTQVKINDFAVGAGNEDLAPSEG